MKKIFMLFVAVMVASGCGRSKTAESPPKKPESGQHYIQEAMNLLKDGDGIGAIKKFDDAIRNDPANVENYLVLGQVYLRMQNYQGALDSFSAAVNVAPNNGEAEYFLAVSKGFMQDRPGAIAAAQKSVEIFMDTKEEEKFKRSLALLYSLQGR